MSRMAELMQVVGLSARSGAEGELWVECGESQFNRAAKELAQRALLSDLFAGITEGVPSLTAVFSTVGDSSWLLLRTTLADDRFLSITPAVHAASWYEREIAEMYGLHPDGHPAAQPLRLHDWHKYRPMRDPLPQTRSMPRVHLDRVPRVRGQGVFQLPLGPVRSGPQESAEFLFNSGGEDLVMVAPRFGYKMRLVERLAEGKSVEDALLLAERLAGISTFANALAFVQAAERAAGMEVGEEARRARSLLNELERLHHHFGHLSRVADSTGMAVPAAQYAALKEEVLRVGADLVGHRYLRGVLAPGGLALKLAEVGRKHLAAAIPRWEKNAKGLESLLEDTATFIDRLDSTAVLAADYAALHNLVGPIGRSTGADRDCRRDHPYAAYNKLQFDVLVKSQGDALARVRIVFFEIRQSLRVVEQLLEHWPKTEPATALVTRGGSALGWAEAPGGEALHFVELDADGHVRRWRARPPAVVNWHPYAHACASGNNLTDYPVIEASFGLSHAEFDR
ncbi:MAG: hydrogenase large subunit [Candidatus Dormibacteraceae bacterium]